MKKKILSLIISGTMFAAILPATVMAAEPDTSEVYTENTDIVMEETEGASDEILPEEEEEIFSEDNSDDSIDIGETEVFSEWIENTYVPGADTLADSDELFAEYVDRVFYGDNEIETFANYGSKILDSQSLLIYNQLKEAIVEVAEGSRTSTVFELDATGIVWTAEELGIGSNVVVDDDIKDQTSTIIRDKIDTVLDCLLVDCPYELYWFDKTQGFLKKYEVVWSIGASSRYLDTVSVRNISITFCVSADYQNGNNTTVNTAKTSAAQKAAENAQSIAAKYTSSTDRQKMTKYKDEICDLVSFNYSASDTDYGDPWQIIYVFDGDSSTNVTCEGYAKAFQYLCDLGLTDSTSYIVTGNLTGKSDSGGHMWNVVSLEGNNYLVDVTNSNTGTVGENGELFLVDASDATSADPGKEYTFYPTDYPLIYTYDETTLSLYSDSIRTLSGTVKNNNTSNNTNSSSGTTTSTATVEKASDGNWYYYVNGKKDTSYTGFATNSNGKWYVEKGKVTKKTNGVFKDKTGAIGSSSEWYYVLNSKVQTSFTGLADYKNDSGWWYITKGKVDRSVNTIAKNKNGWWYVKNGKVDKSYTGFGTNSSGKWYVKSGKVSKKENGVLKDTKGAIGAKNNWYYVLNSKVQTSFTGLANYKNASGWWYITNGKVDRSYNGLAKNKNGWWYLVNGKVNKSYTGLATNSNGTWYVKNGKLQKTFTGTVTISGKKYSVTKGKVKV